MPTSWPPEEIRRIGYHVVDLIAEHLSSMSDRPVFRAMPRDLVDDFLTGPLPKHGVSADDVIRDFRERIEPYPFGNGHPRFWGWVNPPPIVIGVFAEALAAAMNPSCAGGNHAATYVERQVIAWFRGLLSFPAEGMGLLVSGGSMASLTALAVARHVKAGVDVRRDGLCGTRTPFRFYQSSEGHSCLRKAVELLGFGQASIRIVPVDDSYRLDVRALEAAIGEDVVNGVRPIAVTATAGSVNTGAIDPLAAIADVCRRHDVWFHVDAAYGGPAILADTYRAVLEPLALADSVALDPHKWLYIPVEAGLVLVRDAEAMRATFSLVPPYIRTAGSATGVFGLPWFSEYGFQQTRGFRALKVWMALKHLGLDGYKRAIEENLALARYLAERVQQTPDLDLVSTTLSIVCFRFRPAQLEHDADIDRLNRELLERLQLGGEAFVTSTELRGRFVLRACIVNHLSSRADVDLMISAVCRIGTELAAA